MVEYLKTCSLSLVNPTVGYTVNHDINANNQNNSVSTENKTDITLDVKSANSQPLSCDIDEILMTSVYKWRYSVLVEKLSSDDINLWTGRVPHWSKMDPYSDLSEAKTDTSEK